MSLSEALAAATKNVDPLDVKDLCLDGCKANDNLAPLSKFQVFSLCVLLIFRVLKLFLWILASSRRYRPYHISQIYIRWISCFSLTYWKLLLSDNKISGGLEFFVNAKLQKLKTLVLSGNKIKSIDELAKLVCSFCVTRLTIVVFVVESNLHWHSRQSRNIGRKLSSKIIFAPSSSTCDRWGRPWRQKMFSGRNVRLWGRGSWGRWWWRGRFRPKWGRRRRWWWWFWRQRWKLRNRMLGGCRHSGCTVSCFPYALSRTATKTTNLNLEMRRMMLKSQRTRKTTKLQPVTRGLWIPKELQMRSYNGGCSI